MALRRMPTNKGKSARSFRHGVGKTHVYNKKKIMRGGWRL